MKKYQLLMNVENIYLFVESKPKLMGYYQTLVIEADSPERAEVKAIEKIRNDDEIKSIWGKDMQNKPPVIIVEEINELALSNQDKLQNIKGRSFYPAKHWWQFWK